ncbi:MAG: hypothetical protein KKE05_04415 [Nanoarchaeota archaeon]|nr:hypothetical protein [Nanoarchaeota archaeon]
MTDAEREFIIEILKALAGVKRKLEKFINPNSQVVNESKGEKNGKT